MQQNILKIFTFLLTISLNASIDSYPTVIVQETKFIGDIHPDNKVEMFLGLPFAKPPTGEFRWKKPEAWEPLQSSEILVKNFKPACYQNQRIVDWYKRLIEDFGGNPSNFDIPEFSEDCLYLNLWRPRGSHTNLPVIVYIHGGSNKAGWAYEPNYHGHNIADKGFILISIPYRLGVFGFFSHPEVETPNLALFDQILALEWIQKNISLFGGDPSNVTLMGESAGAGSISYLIASPLAKGLFSKAIHQSGGSSFSYPSSEIVAKKLADDFSSSFEDRSLDNLRDISPVKILETSEIVYAGYYFNFLEDGSSVVAPLLSYFDKGAIQGTDLLIGANNDEWSLYFDGDVDVNAWLDAETQEKEKQKLLTILSDIKDPVRKMDLLITAKNFVCPSLFIAEKLQHKGNKTWVYQFNRVRDDELAKKYGAFHGAELPYVFNTHDEWLPTNQDDVRLTESMQRYWLSFARSGNPNNDEDAAWPKFKPDSVNTQILDRNIYSASHPSERLCKFLLE